MYIFYLYVAYVCDFFSSKRLAFRLLYVSLESSLYPKCHLLHFTFGFLFTIKLNDCVP